MAPLIDGALRPWTVRWRGRAPARPWVRPTGAGRLQAIPRSCVVPVTVDRPLTDGPVDRWCAATVDRPLEGPRSRAACGAPGRSRAPPADPKILDGPRDPGASVDRWAAWIASLHGAASTTNSPCSAIVTR